MQGDFENCCSISLGVTPKKCRSKAYCSALNCGNAKFRKPEISYFRFPRDPKRYVFQIVFKIIQWRTWICMHMTYEIGFCYFVNL